MANPDKRHTAEGLKRLIAFADAVVAIALTLLVLPLVDLASEVETRRTLPEIMSDHGDVLIGFLISFIVTWVLWRNHHAIMENYCEYNSPMMNMHFVWLLTIVLLPLATALISNEHVHWADCFYILLLAVSILALIGITREGVRCPELVVDDARARRSVADWTGVGSIIALLIALVMTLVWPGLGSAPLALLLIPGPLQALNQRIRGQKSAVE